MPVTTPVLWSSAAEAGVRLDAVLVVTGSPPAGGSGVFRGSAYELRTDTNFGTPGAALIHAWPMRSPSNMVDLGSSWIDLQLAVLDLAPSTTYKVGRKDTDDTGTASAWSAALSFTTSAADVSVADARESA